MSSSMHALVISSFVSCMHISEIQIGGRFGIFLHKTIAAVYVIVIEPQHNPLGWRTTHGPHPQFEFEMEIPMDSLVDDPGPVCKSFSPFSTNWRSWTWVHDSVTSVQCIGWHFLSNWTGPSFFRLREFQWCLILVQTHPPHRVCTPTAPLIGLQFCRASHRGGAKPSIVPRHWTFLSSFVSTFRASLMTLGSWWLVSGRFGCAYTFAPPPSHKCFRSLGR